MVLIHPQLSPVTAIKLCTCFKVTIALVVKSLSGFFHLCLLSQEGSLYLCSDWVCWYTIESVINNSPMLRGIFNVCFFYFYSSTYRGIWKTPWTLWLNLCLQFITRLRNLTDNCICWVQRGGSHSKIKLNTIIAHRVSPCNLLCDLLSKLLIYLGLP